MQIDGADTLGRDVLNPILFNHRPRLDEKSMGLGLIDSMLPRLCLEGGGVATRLGDAWLSYSFVLAFHRPANIDPLPAQKKWIVWLRSNVEFSYFTRSC
jgi:hypothetical protein